MSEEKLVGFLQRPETAEETCKHLVQAANEAGGPDNITVVVARFQDAQKAAVVQARAEAAVEGHADRPARASDKPLLVESAAEVVEAGG